MSAMIDGFKKAKSYADTIFLENMRTINKNCSPTWVGKQIRNVVIYEYYLAVRFFGDNFLRLQSIKK